MTQPEKKNVFICAAGHSGSTLLDLLLGSHSNMTSLGEITQLPKNIALNTFCSCGSSVKECGHWKRVLTLLGKRLQIDIFKDPYALDLGFIDARVVIDHAKQTRFYDLRRKLVTGGTFLSWRYHLPGLSVFTKIYQTAINNNQTLYDCVRETSGCSVIVDSSKHYMKAAGLYRNAPEQTRIILLTRDGRGIFYSNLKRGFGQKLSLDSWLKHFSRALPLFARKLPSSVIMQVRYEDLCLEPEKTLQAICEFIGLEFESSMLDFSAMIHHVVNGNDMRFIASSDIRCDESWREQLEPADADYFKRYACDLNRQLGYKD